MWILACAPPLPGAHAVALVPEVPSVGVPVACVVDQVLDPEGVGTELTWTADGLAYAEGPTTTAPPRDTTLTCEVRLDGVLVGSASTVVADAPPVVTALRLSPVSPTTTTTLVATAEAEDPDGDAVTLLWTWLGVTAPEAQGARVTLDPALTTRGDEIRAEVTPVANGRAGAALASDPVTIGNTPPDAPGLSSAPDLAVAGEPLACVAAPASDADGDALTVQATWRQGERTADGTLLDDGTYVLPAGVTAAGETWVCTYELSDGRDVAVNQLGVPIGADRGLIEDEAVRLVESGGGAAGVARPAVGEDGSDGVLIATAEGPWLVAPLPDTPGEWGPADVGATWRLATSHAGLVATAGDLDADGASDLVFGLPVPCGGGAGRGLDVSVLAGPAWRLDDAVHLCADTDEAAAEGAVAVEVLPDLDGDGLAELWVGAPGVPGAHDAQAGVAGWVVDGGELGGGGALDDLAARLTHPAEEAAASVGAGALSPGDLDGDGLPDLVVLAPRLVWDGDPGGAAWILTRPLAGGELGAVGGRIDGQDATLALGAAAAAVGDWDGDGLGELALGAPGRAGGHASTSEALYVVAGADLPTTGTYDVAMSRWTLTAEDHRVGFAGALVAAGDLDGDGLGDLWAGLGATPDDGEDDWPWPWALYTAADVLAGDARHPTLAWGSPEGTPRGGILAVGDTVVLTTTGGTADTPTGFHALVRP